MNGFDEVKSSLDAFVAKNKFSRHVLWAMLAVSVYYLFFKTEQK
jgi:hypothetical protein